MIASSGNVALVSRPERDGETGHVFASVPSPRTVAHTLPAEAQRDMRSPVPRQVGPYEIRHEIGRGAAARVFAGRHLGSTRSVAIKEFRSGPGRAHEHGRFLTEARIHGSIDHRHVVPMHDLVDDRRSSALVMELVNRGSLRHHIGSGLGLAQAGGVLEGVLSGLSHLASQRIAHLDIKPDNLLVTPNGSVKIADFGVAQELGPNRAGTSEVTGGTPQYMAPELAIGAPLGGWTDLYAVGILAFELLVGRPPFSDTLDPVDVMERHLRHPVPAVSDLLPGMASSMADWISRLVAKTSSDRPSSADEAWQDLEKVLTECVGSRWRLACGL